MKNCFLKTAAYALAALMLIPAAYLANLARADGMAWGAFSTALAAMFACLALSACMAVLGRMLYWKSRAQFLAKELQWSDDQLQVAVQMR